jgi:hypothetical protein
MHKHLLCAAYLNLSVPGDSFKYLCMKPTRCYLQSAAFDIKLTTGSGNAGTCENLHDGSRIRLRQKAGVCASALGSDKRLSPSSYLSVRLQATTGLYVDGLPSNFTLATSTKTCRPNWIFWLKYDKSNRHFTWRRTKQFKITSRSILLWLKKIQKKKYQIKPKHILCTVHLSDNCAVNQIIKTHTEEVCRVTQKSFDTRCLTDRQAVHKRTELRETKCGSVPETFR